MPRLKLVAAALLIVSVMVGPLIWPFAAEAMRVTPMVAELTTSGAGAVARIEVGNVGSEAMPFETTITRIDYDDEGNLIETPADEDFLVFPPQGLVAVGGRQVVRVQWIGDPNISNSHAYYLSVRQLPVATDPTVVPEVGGGIAVRVVYNMKALIVVAPPGASPDVEVASVTPMMVTPPAPLIDPELTGGQEPEAPPAQPGIEVAVTNSGSRYALMSGATWVVDGMTATGEPFHREYAGAEISQIVGVGYLAPSGGRRVFKLPTDVELDAAKPVTVKFKR